jgi:hypothetical protein
MAQRSKGRPLGSKVRQNIVEILYFYKELHGYELYKIYLDLYPKVSQRLIYYHLKKGVDTGEFLVSKQEKKTGNYSWGQSSENIIYCLGQSASPLIDARIKMYMEENI